MGYFWRLLIAAMAVALVWAHFKHDVDLSCGPRHGLPPLQPVPLEEAANVG